MYRPVYSSGVQIAWNKNDGARVPIYTGREIGQWDPIRSRRNGSAEMIARKTAGYMLSNGILSV